MARSKKTIKKSANKSVNVVVNVNSHNKKKKITQPRSAAHPTIFVNPSGNTGFSEHGLTQQLLHHFILNNRELPKIEYATTDLHKKVDEPKPFATIRAPSVIVKDDKPLLEPTPMPKRGELMLTESVKPEILSGASTPSEAKEAISDLMRDARSYYSAPPRDLVKKLTKQFEQQSQTDFYKHPAAKFHVTIPQGLRYLGAKGIMPVDPTSQRKIKKQVVDLGGFQEWMSEKSSKRR